MRRCPACATIHPATEAACPSCGWTPPLRNGFPAFAPEVDAAGAAGFRPEAFAALAAHEAGNFWFEGRNRLILWAVGRHAPAFSNMLEIGCGTGFVLTALMRAFPKARVTGSEVFTTGLGYAATRAKGATLVQMDARRIGHVDEFDLVGAFDVLEHIAEDETVLSQIHEALVPGGVLVLTVPQHRWLWSHSDDYACHERRYSAAEMHAKLRAAGFRIERSTSFVSLLLPAMLLSRWMQRNKPSSEYDPSSEFRLPGWMNTAFAGLMQIERGLITAGLSLPLGGSRLVVARKPRTQP